MNSLTRGVILSLATAAVGIVVAASPPTGLSGTANTFWDFLTYVWFGLAGVLMVMYAVSTGARLSANAPLALALLVEGAVSLSTAMLAYRTGMIAPMLASSAWLLLFVVIGIMDLAQRSRQL